MSMGKICILAGILREVELSHKIPRALMIRIVRERPHAAVSMSLGLEKLGLRRTHKLVRKTTWTIRIEGISN